MSSLSMNKVRGRAINANTQNTNNFSMWMEPLSHKDYPLRVFHFINNTTILWYYFRYASATASSSYSGVSFPFLHHRPYCDAS